MFLCAVTRPRFDSIGECIFDGKSGCWEFCEKIPAVRSSKNRPKGTLVTTNISVGRKVYLDYLITKLLPRLKEIWPNKNEKILIEQDNATSHIPISNLEFHEVAKKGGWDFQLFAQPPNSPDCNILDLGFFAGIQSLQRKNNCKNMDQLICVVKEAFMEYSPQKLNNFLTLQTILIEIMKIEGSNNCELKHIKKKCFLARVFFQKH
jgi:hypothetical protein